MPNYLYPKNYLFSSLRSLQKFVFRVVNSTFSKKALQPTLFINEKQFILQPFHSTDRLFFNYAIKNAHLR